MAHTHAAANLVPHVLPPHGPFGLKVRLLDRLGAHYDLATVLSASLHKVCSPGLALGAHQGSHGDFDFADHVSRARTAVHVDHLKLIFLHLFEPVGHSEARLKVRVQVVVDDLSLADLAPLIVLQLEDLALGVRLAERVQVLQLAT